LSRSWSKKARRGWKAQTEKILPLYARGMTTGDIQAQLKELYSVEVSPGLISNVTEAVMEEVLQWQSRPLEAIYPIVYLDCLVVKVKENQRVSNKAVYLALCVTLSGNKEGLCCPPNLRGSGCSCREMIRGHLLGRCEVEDGLCIRQISAPALA